MGKKLYVGNLPYGLNDGDLRKLFEPFGQVRSAQIIMDRATGRSKGFGFVEMDSADDAQAAIAALSGQEIGGRSITTNEARPREERDHRGARFAGQGQPSLAAGRRY